MVTAEREELTKTVGQQQSLITTQHQSIINFQATLDKQSSSPTRAGAPEEVRALQEELSKLRSESKQLKQRSKQEADARKHW